MSTRFIRKRYRRVIPIGEARLRESYLARGVTHRHRSRYYPLYETAESIYNYENLMECLRNWNEYSADTEDNVNNSANILKIMASHDGSTVQNLYEATRVICNDILPYVKHPSKYEKTFSKLEGDKLQESKSTILDKLYILKECDRVLENYKTISEVVNPIEFFRQDLKIRSLSESLYRFCDKIEDNFELEYPANFCIAMESALYALDHLVKDEVDKRRVSEGVIDYYLVNGGNENLNKFAESLDYCLQKDEFLPNEINDYMLYIQQVMNKDQIMKEAVEEYFSNKELQLIDDYNNLMRSNAYDVVQEFQIFDKAKEIFTKFKALPNKTVATVKEAINALFVTSRVQDMKKNTLNALSIIFYFLMGVGIAVGIGGAVGGLLGLLVTLNIHHATNKEYLQDAIEGWTKHKHDVERRLNNAQGDERNKLSDYLEEVDKNITLLSNKYEAMRDETSDEISSRAAADSHAHPSDDLTNPIGHNPLSATKNEDKPVKEETEILQEFKMLNTEEILLKIKNRIKTDLHPKDKKEIQHKLIALLEFILFVSAVGIITTAEFSTFINIIIFFTALSLIDILNTIDKAYSKSILNSWKSHITTVSNKLKGAKGEEKTRLNSYNKALQKGLTLLKYATSIPKDSLYSISEFSSSLLKNIDLLFTDKDLFLKKYKTLVEAKLSKANSQTIDPTIFLVLQITFTVVFCTYALQWGFGMLGQIIAMLAAVFLAKFISVNLSGKFITNAFAGISRFETYFRLQMEKVNGNDKPIFQKYLDMVIKMKEDISNKFYSPRLGR